MRRISHVDEGLPFDLVSSVRESDDMATAPAEAGGTDGEGGAGAEGGEEGEDTGPGDGDPVLICPGKKQVDGLEGGKAVAGGW